jgi:hypothetical protein
MPRGRGPKLGHITFRLPPEVHAQLIEFAGVLLTDVSGVLKTAVAEGLPEVAARVEAIRRKREPVRVDDYALFDPREA